MCFYRGTVYSCKHSEFGKKVSDCKVQRDFLDSVSKEKNACNERQIHSMNRVRNDSRCRKCQRLDALRTRTRKTFLSLRENLEKRKTTSEKPATEAGESSSGISSSEHAPGDVVPNVKHGSPTELDGEACTPDNALDDHPCSSRSKTCELSRELDASETSEDGAFKPDGATFEHDMTSKCVSSSDVLDDVSSPDNNGTCGDSNQNQPVISVSVATI
ncbi:hypothetical protein CTA2_4135 [Colletotrichum tanaceti]|uniref:Uncharacterized protein n=1 Tax=Colletotrichum tanaceti TaxID=1306861 RepID=A0A4U6XVV0_9PEZI|nr:hypothetical protein CTA2_4135 [Colletotrichum tanaceti]TKW60175.1 hypothetical protein CTA1_4870 [Colletotrichum tanaceti]